MPTDELLAVGEGDADETRLRQLVVITGFTEQHLASRDIEEQTGILYLQRRVPLWVAVKSVIEACFHAWAQIDAESMDLFAMKAGSVRARYAKELDELVRVALGNPLDLKAIARVAQLGINSRRTLEATQEALLGYPAQKALSGAVPAVIVRIDWALGGISEWPQVHHFSFEEGLAVPFAKARTFYSTEKSGRRDITSKQIANIFLVQEHVIEAIEARALRGIRKSFPQTTGSSSALGEFAVDYLAGL